MRLLVLTAVGITVASVISATPPTDGAQACPASIDTTPLLTIGDGRLPSDELFRVGAGFVVGVERAIVLANRGTSQLRFYDRVGDPVRTVGGSGGGPGEFRALMGPWIVEESLFVAFDPQLQRLTTLGLDGELRVTAPLQPRDGVRWPTVVGAFGGAVVAINGQVFERGEQGIGAVRPPFVFLRYGRDGALIDTLTKLPGTEFYVPPSRQLTGTVRMPLGVDLLYGFVGTALYYVDTEGARLMEFREGRRPRLVRDLRIERRRIQPADRARFLESAIARARGPAQQAAAKALATVPFPQRTPTLDRILVGRSGDVWLRAFTTQEDRPTTWYVVDVRSGAYCTTSLPPRTTPLFADAGHMLVVTRTADDEEVVRLYRIIR